MLVKEAGLPGNVPNEFVRAWNAAHTYAGNVVSKKTAHKAPPKEWPPHTEDGLDHMHPALSNRKFFQNVTHWWQGHMTPADKLAWKNLAATITIKNYKGVSKQLTALRLYRHFETMWKP